MGNSMSGFVLAGDSSGSITLQATSVAGSNTITLPAETGTVLTTATNHVFRAHASANVNGPINTFTKVAIDTVTIDTAGNSWNSVSRRFIPTSPGYYKIGAQVQVNMTGGGGFTIYAEIWKNGAVVNRYAQLINYTSGFNQTLNPIDTIMMNGTTDYIEIYYWNNNGTAQYVPGSASTYMTAEFLRGL
jgi:hypothetical protein